MKDLSVGGLIAVALFSTFVFGWAYAHSEVAWECRNIGTFYVGTTVYECKAKEKNA